KWVVWIDRVKEIVPTLQRVFVVAQEVVPGSVFVECPIDILYDEELVRSWYGTKKKESMNVRERIVRWYTDNHAKKLFAGKDSIAFDNPTPNICCPIHSESQITK